MQRRYNLAHLILASVIILVLAPLMVVFAAQAQIALYLIGMGTMKSM